MCYLLEGCGAAGCRNQRGGVPDRHGGRLLPGHDGTIKVELLRPFPVRHPPIIHLFIGRNQLNEEKT